MLQDMNSIKNREGGQDREEMEVYLAVHAVAGGTTTWRPLLLSPASATTQEQGTTAGVVPALAVRDL